MKIINILISIFIIGCYELNTETISDSSVFIDSGLIDSGLIDSVLVDSELVDSGLIDSELVDSGLIDNYSITCNNNNQCKSHNCIINRYTYFGICTPNCLGYIKCNIGYICDHEIDLFGNFVNICIQVTGE